MKIADLFVQLGVKTDTKELTAFNQVLKETVGNLDKLKKEIGDGLTKKVKEDGNEKKQGIFGFLKNLPKLIKSSPIIASLVYIAKAISQVTLRLAKLVLNLTQVSYETLKLARNFGVSTSAMQRFGYEAVASGVKLNDFQSAVARLKQNSADILLGRGDISPYALLGINPHEDPEKVLMHLQQRLKELPESIGTAFASDLGLSPDMINFVRKADFSKIANRPQLSRSELKALDDLRGKLLETMNLFSLVGQKILVVFTPLFNTILKPLTNMLTRWSKSLQEIHDTIMTVFVAIGGIMSIINPVFAVVTAIGLVLDDLVINKGKGLIRLFQELARFVKLVFLNPFIDFFDFIKEGFNWIVDKVKSLGQGALGIVGKFLDQMGKFYKPEFSYNMGKPSKSEVDVNISLNGDVKIKDSKGSTVGTIDSSNITTDLGANPSNLSYSGVKP